MSCRIFSLVHIPLQTMGCLLNLKRTDENEKSLHHQEQCPKNHIELSIRMELFLFPMTDS